MSGDNHNMSIPRTSASIIRSIRQISLYRDWVTIRGQHNLPSLADFKPSERADDASEISVNEVVHQDSRIRYRVHEAGQFIETATGESIVGKFLDEFLDPGVIEAAHASWDKAVIEQLPVYIIIGMRDANGIPVTMENLHLPLSKHHDTSDFMASSMHIFSDQGRYQHAGLFLSENNHKLKRRDYIIDPDIAFDVQIASELDIEFV